MTPKTSCIVCDRQELVPFFRLEKTPIQCNRLYEEKQMALRAPLGNIELVCCQTCGHVFNQSFPSHTVHYSTLYENALHFSPRFQRYAKSLSENLIRKYQLRQKTILEIGSGDGYFLSLMCSLGDNHGIGFDPGYIPPSQRKKQERAPAAFNSRVEFHQDIYPSPDIKLKRTPDFIICRHVLEHLDSPLTLLQKLQKIDTTVYFEVPNFEYTLQHDSYWDILFEHHSYFSISSLSTLFSRAGFEILDLQPRYGGQFLSIEARSKTGSDSPGKHIHEPSQSLIPQTQGFADQFQATRGKWQRLLGQYSQQGDKTVTWGAGSKGIIFLNHVASNTIQLCVDINPRKQGKFIPGSGQKVISPADLKLVQPDHIVVMNPLYEQEIQHALDDMRLSHHLMTI